MWQVSVGWDQSWGETLGWRISQSWAKVYIMFGYTYNNKC